MVSYWRPHVFWFQNLWAQLFLKEAATSITHVLEVPKELSVLSVSPTAGLGTLPIVLKWSRSELVIGNLKKKDVKAAGVSLWDQWQAAYNSLAPTVLVLTSEVVKDSSENLVLYMVPLSRKMQIQGNL